MGGRPSPSGQVFSFGRPSRTGDFRPLRSSLNSSEREPDSLNTQSSGRTWSRILTRLTSDGSAGDVGCPGKCFQTPLPSHHVHVTHAGPCSCPCPPPPWPIFHNSGTVNLFGLQWGIPNVTKSGDSIGVCTPTFTAALFTAVQSGNGPLATDATQRGPSARRNITQP